MAQKSYPERRGIYLITFPRSASNLFQRMIAKQPRHQNSAYKLFEAAFPAMCALDRGALGTWPDEDRKAFYDNAYKSWEVLQDEVDSVQQSGKESLIKEHSIMLWSPDRYYTETFKHDKIEPITYTMRDDPKSPHTNPSSIPDNFLLALQPIFQIRHPGLMFPSMVRARAVHLPPGRLTQLPSVSTVLTLKYSRTMYDWYLENAAEDRQPKIIDADDIMTDPATVRQLCIETGLDPDSIQYEWETREEDHPLKKVFLSTVNASTGIVKGLDAKNLDLAAEKEKWIAAFGQETADDLERMVNDAMPDYEYLLSKRTRAEGSLASHP